jgi:hypothetical protein
MKSKLVFFIFIVFFIALLSIVLRVENSTQTPLSKSEKVIDAFYSFDPKKLNIQLFTAPSSKALVLYYQGWAKGGNYQVVNRMPCIEKDNEKISCSITVKDDLMKALDIPFDVTDTFHLTFKNGILKKVTTSSNDLQVFRDAEKWVFEKHPEWVAIPCKDYFNGGPTPDKCVKAMVKGYSAFANSEDFSEDVKF